MPRDLFSEFFVCDSGISSNVGVCINFGLLIDFLQLSLTRGSREIEFTSWNNFDFISLRFNSPMVCVF